MELNHNCPTVAKAVLRFSPRQVQPDELFRSKSVGFQTLNAAALRTREPTTTQSPQTGAEGGGETMDGLCDLLKLRRALGHV